jgi:L-ascorbate metabolism protein UlaG (beta-lactamase superfamily)
MKIKFTPMRASAWKATVSVITDPYTPKRSGFAPINEPADIVIMSSATDDFHSVPSHVHGNPVIVNALEIPREGIEVKELRIRSFPAMESLTYDFGRDPDANAFYLFTLDGLRVLHMGDIGNPVPPEHLDVLAGQVDVLLALTGAHATIALDDLDDAITTIQPCAVIPMHYWSPKGVLAIEPVDAFLARLPPERVTHVRASEIELRREILPPIGHPPQVFVLDQSR